MAHEVYLATWRIFLTLGMTAKKYMSINKTTKSTATRDLQQLVDINAFLKKGAGRATSYDLNLDIKR